MAVRSEFALCEFRTFSQSCAGADSSTWGRRQGAQHAAKYSQYSGLPAPCSGPLAPRKAYSACRSLRLRRGRASAVGGTAAAARRAAASGTTRPLIRRRREPLNAPLHYHLVRVVVLRLPRKLRRHAATGRYTCSVGMLRRHAPSACTGRMHSSVSTAGMLRRHAPSACTGRMHMLRRYAPAARMPRIGHASSRRGGYM